MDIFPRGSSEKTNPLSQINLEGGLTDRQKKLILVFIIVIILMGVILYFGFFSTPSATQQEAITQMTQAPIAEEAIVGEAGSLSVATNESQVFNLEGVALNFSIFNNETFKGLEESGSPLDLSGEKGRENPFMPY